MVPNELLICVGKYIIQTEDSFLPCESSALFLQVNNTKLYSISDQLTILSYLVEWAIAVHGMYESLMFNWLICQISIFTWMSDFSNLYTHQTLISIFLTGMIKKNFGG